jgi:hypothetical protein
MMKQIASAITTLPREPSTGIGMPRGEHGLATADDSRLAGWLADRKPGDVDKAAVLRASRHGVELSVDYDYRFPRDEKGNPMPMIKIVKGCSVSGSDENRRTALSDIERLQQNAPATAIESWLAELSVITAKRSDDEFTETLRLEAYTKRLRKYPADVAKDALMGRSWKFWPTWAELELVCDSLAAPRRAMIRAMAAPMDEKIGQREQRMSAERADEIFKEVWGER